MSRLPELKLVLVKVEPDEETEQRMKEFKSIIRRALQRRYTAKTKQEEKGIG
ncbi:hypothetical protein [Geosporobacter ferrireducens]|uniref:hypothetical protein n=1 Tax=Geosporobacter ferrireducens TaxID=1424294 RepID=UPI0012EAF65F|nr:hypothetical protein [Geosporobacter ferrireducens]